MRGRSPRVLEKMQRVRSDARRPETRGALPLVSRTAASRPSIKASREALAARVPRSQFVRDRAGASITRVVIFDRGTALLELPRAEIAFVCEVLDGVRWFGRALRLDRQGPPATAAGCYRR